MPHRITTPTAEHCDTGKCSLTVELDRLRKENAALMEDNKQLRAAMSLFQYALSRGPDTEPECI